MYAKTILFISAIFLSIQVNGQEKPNKVDLRVGTGISLLGSVICLHSITKTS
jgi:hypothetical protein